MNNNRALFIASFLTLIAAGFGFAVRGAILGDWGTAFGFTKLELGEITGMGFAGGGIAIILFSTITDRVGYKAILIGAFALHVLSAVVTLAATPAGMSPAAIAAFLGAPPSIHETMVWISCSVSRGSFLSTPCGMSDPHGGIVFSVTRRLIERSHGRASSNNVSDIGANIVGRWHSMHGL